jgi:hypothetical protein
VSSDYDLGNGWFRDDALKSARAAVTVWGLLMTAAFHHAHRRGNQ